MIQHHGSFAVQLPSGWAAPRFQFGQSVQGGSSPGQVVGLEYVTAEQGQITGCLAGWWIWVLEAKTLSNGKAIADVFGYHESVIQALPCDVLVKYECRVAV